MTQRIGVLGLHHDHVWGNLEELQRAGLAELVAAADPFPELRQRFSSEFDAPVYNSYQEMLDQEDLTGVYIFASNKVSEELAVEACNRGLHCLVEKPMAASLEGARKMMTAADKNNVQLMINWPFVWWPQIRHAIKLTQDYVIGDVWQVRYRAAHQGPVELGCSKYFCDWLYDKELNGAGALMDYCCYGAILCQVLLGSPMAVRGLGINTGFKPDLKLEDNAVLILKYPNAMGLTEASWTQVGKLTSYTTTIYGSKGTLHVEPEHGGKLWLASAENEQGEAIEIPESPWHLETASTHFLASIENRQLELHPLCQPRNCVGSQAIMHAGLEVI